jgi:formamidopyrimidine-DNA glycosylase
LLKTFDPPLKALVDTRFMRTGRHGKHLLLEFSDDLVLALHLGIGGRMVFAQAGKNPPRAVSLELSFDDGTALRVVELGTKKRSSAHVLRSDQVAEHLQSLGIDALDPKLTPDRLGELLRSERMQLKTFLENQHKVAGIGNAYSDDILWEARLAPLRMTSSVEDEEAVALLEAIRKVLAAAIERARDNNYLLVARGDERHSFQVHRRTGEPCPRCGEPIASIYLAETNFQYCPACQHDGKAYADRRLSRLLK